MHFASSSALTGILLLLLMGVATAVPTEPQNAPDNFEIEDSNLEFDDSASFESEDSASFDTMGAPRGHPDYTTANARRYPWPMGSYIRNARYFDDYKESVQEATNSGATANVDCYYTRERWHADHHLQYVVRIDPMRTAWYNLCSGIYDNIKRFCGRSADCNNVEPGCWCDRHMDTPLITPAVPPSVKMYPGQAFFFPMRHWKEGDENTQCVAAAIQSALGGIPTAFNKGGCYKMLGSQLHSGEGLKELKPPATPHPPAQGAE